MKLLNIGCGATFHPAWTNVDMVSSSPHVIAYDIRKRLPFGDAVFDAVYHSHVIEHLTSHDAVRFLKECYRVLKPGGHLRVATPDLESIARVYLERLDASRKGEPNAADDHRWMVLELIDQMVRDRPGGAMRDFLVRPDLPNRAFILSRIGQEARQFWEPMGRPVTARPTAALIYGKLSRLIRRGLQEAIAGALVLISGPSGRRAYREGRFRASGEIHRWLYDAPSLMKVFEEATFIDVRPCSADESRIADFGMYYLDVVNGIVRKPDSLFMEGSRPH